jgi:hypothetical protein
MLFCATCTERVRANELRAALHARAAALNEGVAALAARRRTLLPLCALADVQRYPFRAFVLVGLFLTCVGRLLCLWVQHAISKLATRACGAEGRACSRTCRSVSHYDGHGSASHVHRRAATGYHTGCLCCRTLFVFIFGC